VQYFCSPSDSVDVSLAPAKDDTPKEAIEKVTMGFAGQVGSKVIDVEERRRDGFGNGGSRIQPKLSGHGYHIAGTECTESDHSSESFGAKDVTGTLEFGPRAAF
jgi:hypothetical protein